MEIPNESYNEINSMLSSGTIDVSVDKINELNIILNDHDCGNAFFKNLCDKLSEKGIVFQTSVKDDNIMQENATIVTLDQQNVTGENIELIGPCKYTNQNDSAALLKAFEVVFKKRGITVDCLAGIGQYQSLDNGDVIYTSVPSDTEKNTFANNSQITVSLGTLDLGYSIDMIVDNLIEVFVRYQYFLENEKDGSLIEEKIPNKTLNNYDNHYIFPDKIDKATAFNPDVNVVIEPDFHKSM